MSAAERFLAVVRKHMLDPSRAATPDIWSPGLESLSRDALRSVQEEKLACAFDYLHEESTFYRKRFDEAGLGPGSVKTLDDLRKVPITRKMDWISDIEAHPPWGDFSPLRPERWSGGAGWTIFSTSGTTRTPRLFRHTSHDREVFAWMTARALWSYGIRPGYVALNCFFYGPSVAAWGLHHGLHLLGCAVIPGGPIPSEKRASMVHLTKPQVLLGTPSTLLSLAHRLKQQGFEPASAGVKVLVCAGEPGASVPATRRRLEATWGAAVHDDFGCTEVAQVPLGYTCSAAVAADGTSSVHLMEDAHIVEVLDPETLEPTPPGQRGTLVVTNLYSEGGPYLRYDMGDWIAVTNEACACGRTHARALGGLVGRNDHCLKIKGLQFFPGTFEDALRSLATVGDEYRIEVDTDRGEDSAGPERDIVRIVAERALTAVVTESEVAMRLRGILGISVLVTLVDAGTLPRTEGKGVRFVDRRVPTP
jgi:phenylacetate-CoA ligase